MTARRLERDTATVGFDVSIGGLSDASAAWVLVAGARGENLRGLHRTDAAGRLEWTGESETATVSLVPTTSGDGERGLAVAGETWSYGPVPTLVVAWRDENGTARRSIRPFAARERPGVSVAVPAGGFVGRDVALVGDATTHARDLPANGAPGGGSATGRIRLHVPAGVDPRARPDRVLDALARAAPRLAGGSADGTIPTGTTPGSAGGSKTTDVVVLPDTVRPGGATYVESGEGWVNADAPLTAANNVWLHEYVHARQAVALGAEMQWYREASAEYLAARLALAEGLASEWGYLRHLSGDAGAGAVLANRSTWPDGVVAYTKGARVLAALDRTIRERTDGRRTLFSVFARLNDYDGTVTREGFAAVVSRVAGTDMRGWIERYVGGSGALRLVPPPRGGAGGAGGESPTSDPLLAVGLLAIVGVVLGGDRFGER